MLDTATSPRKTWCQYIASADDLDDRGATDLVFSVLGEAKAAQRNVCFSLNNALTDMVAVLEDPGWVTHREVGLAFAAMGGVNQQKDGTFVMDPTVANNAFDLPSAERVYATLQSKGNRNPPFIVVSRHAASSCQMPRSALDGGSIQWRCGSWVSQSHHSKSCGSDVSDRRRRGRWRTILSRCGAMNCGSALLYFEANHMIWPFVKGFNEYDALTTIAAGTPCVYQCLVVPLFFCVFVV